MLQQSKRLLSAIAFPVGIALVVQGSVAHANPVEGDIIQVDVSYAGEVVPILQQYCYSCHGGPGEDGEPLIELGYDMTTYEGLMAGSEYGPVIEAGDPDESLFLEMIVDGDMPEDGDPLPADAIEILRNWIAEGAQNN